MARTVEPRSWGDPTSPQRILYLHGLGAHSGWVAPLAQVLGEAGFFITAFDLPGHGQRRQPDPSGRHSAEHSIPSPGRLLDSVVQMLGHPTLVGETSSPSPVWLVGTSLGACLAALYAATAGPDVTVTVASDTHRRSATWTIRGVVLLAPAFRPCYLPLHEMAGMALHLANTTKTFATPVARGVRICSDREQQHAFATDPLGTPGFNAMSHLWAQILIARAELNLRKVRIPLLCFQGDQDFVVDARHNEKLFRGHPHGRFEWVQGGFHDLQSEPGIDDLGTRIETALRTTHPGRPS